MGLPQRPNTIQSVFVLDDGTGPRLYGSGVWTEPLTYWLLRWTGQSWEQPPPGFFVYSQYGTTMVPLASFDDGTGLKIYGYQCTGAHCPYGSGVVRWTGTSWVALGSPVNSEGYVNVLGGFDLGDGKKLFAGGSFSSLGGVAANSIAMWDGAAWQPLGAGIIGTCFAMCPYDDGRGPALYVCGASTAGGAPVHGLARWDGRSWSDVGGGVSEGITITGLTVFDDGRGPALYAAGSFGQVGGVNARGIARWDGSQWAALGNGLFPSGYYERYSFAVFNDASGPSLFVGGTFGYAGAGATSGLAQWVGCPNCYANCDNSTASPRLNVNDFICFLNRFAARDPYANCTVDSTIDVADFACFLSKFAAGCT